MKKVSINIVIICLTVVVSTIAVCSAIIFSTSSQAEASYNERLADAYFCARDYSAPRYFDEYNNRVSGNKSGSISFNGWDTSSLIAEDKNYFFESCANKFNIGVDDLKSKVNWPF